MVIYLDDSENRWRVHFLLELVNPCSCSALAMPAQHGEANRGRHGEGGSDDDDDHGRSRSRDHSSDDDDDPPDLVSMSEDSEDRDRKRAIHILAYQYSRKRRNRIDAVDRLTRGVTVDHAVAGAVAGGHTSIIQAPDVDMTQRISAAFRHNRSGEWPDRVATSRLLEVIADRGWERNEDVDIGQWAMVTHFEEPEPADGSGSQADGIGADEASNGSGSDSSDSSDSSITPRSWPGCEYSDCSGSPTAVAEAAVADQCDAFAAGAYATHMEVFDLEYFRALRPPNRYVRQHRVALEWHRRIGDKLNLSVVPFSNSADNPVAPIIEQCGTLFSFVSEEPSVHWKWQYLVAHMDDDSKKLILQGLDGQSRIGGLVSCRLQKTKTVDFRRREAAWHQQRKAHELGTDVVIPQGPPGGGDWYVWDFVVVCDNGVEIHVDPAWTKNSITCYTGINELSSRYYSNSDLRFMESQMPVMIPVCKSTPLDSKPTMHGSPRSPPPSCRCPENAHPPCKAVHPLWLASTSSSSNQTPIYREQPPTPKPLQPKLGQCSLHCSSYLPQPRSGALASPPPRRGTSLSCTTDAAPPAAATLIAGGTLQQQYAALIESRNNLTAAVATLTAVAAQFECE